MKIKNAIAITALALGFGALSVPAQATSTYGFYNVSNNSPDDLSQQLALDVRYDADAEGMIFRIRNDANTTTTWLSSNIHEIYFDLGTTSNLLTSMSIFADSDGFGGKQVSYAGMDPATVSPGDLPSPNQIAFTADYAADQTCNSCGINVRGEWIEFLGKLGSGAGLDGLNILSALSAGNFRVGLHIGGLTGDESDSYITPINPVPLPAAAWLFGSALLGFVSFSVRRKA